MPFEKKFHFQKRKIFYRITGEGPAVVLLHGVPLDGDLWKHQFNALHNFKLIIPDLPGSGKSEEIDDMSLEGMSEVIKAILAEEEISVACLVGHSMGGYISLAFAEKYSEHLCGFGLFHSTAYADSEEKKAGRLKTIETIKNKGAFEFAKNSIPNLFSDRQKEKSRFAIEELVKKANNFSAEILVIYQELMRQRPDRTSVLKKLKVPVLFVAGKDDTAAPLKDVLEQCHLPEKSYFHTLTGSGHMGMIEESEKSNFILENYLLNLTC
jgi:pimeloyl-ACP methyl ester carboxylesterase